MTKRRRRLPPTTAWIDNERDFIRLAYDYFAALDILAEYVFRYPVHSSAEAEMLIHPMMYLYRHALECVLKYFLWGRLVRKPTKGHDLRTLYNALFPTMEPLTTVRERKPLEYIVNFYSKYDTASAEFFRYPYDRNGNPLPTPKLSPVDFKRMYQNVKAVQETLLKFAYELGGDDMAEELVFHDQFETVEINEEMEKKLGAKIRTFPAKRRK